MSDRDGTEREEGSQTHLHVGSWKTRGSAGPRGFFDFRLTAGTTALVIVDLQNYSTHPDVGWAPLYREHFPQVAAYMAPRMRGVVLPNVARLLERARKAGVRVVYLRLGSHLTDWTDMMPFHLAGARGVLARYGRKTIAVHGTFEHQIPDEIAPLPGEIILDKVTKSAFTSTGIDQILRNMGIAQLLFCGAATDACVESTARDAADRGYQCVMVDDACATHDQQAHDATMRAFDRLFGRVMTVEEVCAEVPFS